MPFHALQLNSSARHAMLEEEAAEYRGRSESWRAKAIEQLVEAGWEILMSRSDRRRVLDLDDDPPSDYYEKLARRRARTS